MMTWINWNPLCPHTVSITKQFLSVFYNSIFLTKKVKTSVFYLIQTADDDEDLLYISQLTTCYSDHLNKWTYGLYVYKGLLLIFGLYMAWETRNVNIPALNDSRYIGMNVYNVVMMSVLVVTLSNILSHQPTLAYILESTFMLISTTITLCLLFVPKVGLYACILICYAPLPKEDRNIHRYRITCYI